MKHYKVADKKLALFDVFKLILSIIFCQLAGIIGSVFTRLSVSNWYVFLDKPSFMPPSWLFGPVWIILYLLMGISAFLVWNKGLDYKGVKKALTIFLVQLILNAFWSVAFFGLKSPLFGFLVITILWFAILLTIFNFFKVTKTAGFLLIPYILWVSFAAVLNFSIIILNI
jgi:tryptophan-rich sensory protein